MEYINIISKEEITKALVWPSYIIGGIVIALLIGLMICSFTMQDPCKVLERMLAVGGVGLLTFFVIYFITAIFFRVPTGRYRYEATVDKDKITVSEYEKFIEEYNPTIKDGIYYWEDKEE